MLQTRPLLRSLRKVSYLFSSSSFCHSSCKRPSVSFAPAMEPPMPKKIPSMVSAHGTTWVDPYRWMSNKDDPDLLDHLLKENSYAEAFMADTRDLQRTLVAEMESRMPPSISTPPERWGPWIYYQFIPEGKEYPILCRRLTRHNGLVKILLNYTRSYGEEEVLLDWNDIAEQYGYVQIGTCRISPDQKFLAYTLDTSGGEVYMLQIKDLTTGHTFSDSRVMGVVSLAWSTDSSYLLYTVCDESQRPYRVFCKKLGSDVDDDLLFTECDSSCCVDITSTKDGKFITINSNSRVHVMDATNLKEGFRLVRKRVLGVQYFLEHHHGFFYILTNAPLESNVSVPGVYHLARCKAGKKSSGNWKDIIIPGPDITFQDMDMFHGHLVLFVHKKEAAMFCSINMPLVVDAEEPMHVEELDPWFFPLPSSFCNVVPGSNHDFMSTIYRVVVSSPVMPDTVVDYDMDEKKYAITHQDEVLGLTNTNRAQSNADSLCTYALGIKSQGDQHLLSVKGPRGWSDLSETFLCERKEVVSHDDVKVPLTIFYSRETQLTGQSPGLLFGYGAYGEVLDKSWSVDHISLLARGWILAYADVRGGGDMSWHQAGSRLDKLNSILDFAACGMYLVNEGYVHKNLLAAVGCSAGGLLVGAAINKHPGLFRAAILKVPFLDICNTMLDPTLPLTILDYDEFGDPRVKTEFENIRNYSPYENIAPWVCYPSALVTASLHDSRVGVWEAAKWVARVRESTCSACSHSVILKTNMSGGHFAEGGRHSHCEDAAFEYAFLLKVMGLLDGENPTEAI